MLDRLIGTRRFAPGEETPELHAATLARVLATDPVLFLWTEDLLIAAADRVRLPYAGLRADALFSRIETWAVR